MSQGSVFERVSDLFPLLPLKDIVVFPQMILPVFVMEDICLRAIEAACAKDRLIFLSAFRYDMTITKESCPELKVSTPPPFDVYDIGTIATVLRTRKLPDGRTKVLIQGISRAQLVSMPPNESYPLVQIKPLNDASHGEHLPQLNMLCQSIKEQLEKLVTLSRSISPDILMLLGNVFEPSKFADLVASNLGLKIEEAQKILGSTHIIQRLQQIQMALIKEYETLILGHKNISLQKEDKINKIKEPFSHSKPHKQMLPENEPKDEDIENMKEKVLQSGMPEDASAECLKQIRRLDKMNQDSSEATLTRTYIEWMIDLPWNKFSQNTIEMSYCKRILDEDHYGLERIKDRILEYIAVKKLNPNLKAPILCFVGPPGVGKTSLGKSIAKSLGRQFARISLGGVKDEAEIRGHRRTYVGAMPGRILQCLKSVGVKNPVLMLDEIDKLSSDQKGDPSSALLEVLDPEQNSSFSDHYVSVPFDLSQVIFLANANRLDTIPAPLRDRLEIIEVSGYSEEEKHEISKQYIIPKTIVQNGLNKELIHFQEAAIGTVINSYTRESGLRNLEKNVSSIVRKLARYIAENDEKGKERKAIKVTPQMARELLGEEKFILENHNLHQKIIGSCVGLAYTQTGGEILSLEVKLMPGTPKLILTGHLGDVMKESAQIALSCIRANAEKWGLDNKLFTEKEIHLHVPCGAIPKDGPSAGGAIALALLSAFKQKPLRQDIALTGEINLQGDILAIGGVREKILAALRHGIQTICLPEQNKGIFSELSMNIRKKVHVVFVSSLEEIWNAYFEQTQTLATIDLPAEKLGLDYLIDEVLPAA